MSERAGGRPAPAFHFAARCMTEPFKPAEPLPPDIPLHDSEDVNAVWRVVADRRVDIEQVLQVRFPEIPSDRLRDVMQGVFDLLQLYPESFTQVIALWQEVGDGEAVS